MFTFPPVAAPSTCVCIRTLNTFMEETSGNMAPLGAIESQHARAAQPTSSPMQGDVHGAPAPEDAVENAPLEVPGDSEMAENAVETAAATSVETAEAATVPPRNVNEESAAGDAMEQLVVNLKFLHRERVTLECAASILVSEFKQRVRDAYIHAVQHEQAVSDGGAQQEHEPEPATQPLRLIYKGKVLKDDQSLASYGFVSGDTIHAVFSRVASPVASGSAGEATTRAAPSGGAASNGGEVASGEASDEDEQGVRLSYTRFDVPEGADIGQFISSVLTSAFSAPDGTPSPNPTYFFPLVGLGSPATATTASVSPTPPTPTPQAPSASTPRRGATVTPTTSAAPVNAPQPIRSAQTTGPTTAVRPPATPSGSSSLLNDAAALRRSIPALELVPLARPPHLSAEMYTLGNAMREAGDTYLAIHRQLQFIATRFLQDNHLTTVERERLRSRVQQLIPVLERLSSLSMAVSQQLAGSPYGHVSSGSTTPGQTRSSQGQTAPVTQSASGQASASPQASPITELVSRLVQLASSNQQSTSDPSATATQVLNAIPNILGLVAALAGGSQASSQTAGSTTPAGGASAAPASQTQRSDTVSGEMDGNSIAPVSDFPLWSLGFKLQQHLTSRPDYLSLSFDEFVGVVSSLVLDHIDQCCAPGTDHFIRIATEEVEKAFEKVAQDQGRSYSRDESRCGIIRVALQELAHLSQVAIHEVDETRNAKIASWIRRSCMHFFIAVSQSADAPTSARLTAAVAAHLVAGDATPPTPLHEAVVARTYDFLGKSFSLP